MCRSRKGAWIEIKRRLAARPTVFRRSRKGAWIEMLAVVLLLIQMASRSRKGAWIEIRLVYDKWVNLWSLPQGSVD